MSPDMKMSKIADGKRNHRSLHEQESNPIVEEAAGLMSVSDTAKEIQALKSQVAALQALVSSEPPPRVIMSSRPQAISLRDPHKARNHFEVERVSGLSSWRNRFYKLASKFIVIDAILELVVLIAVLLAAATAVILFGIIHGQRIGTEATTLGVSVISEGELLKVFNIYLILKNRTPNGFKCPEINVAAWIRSDDVSRFQYVRPIEYSLYSARGYVYREYILDPFATGLLPKTLKSSAKASQMLFTLSTPIYNNDTQFVEGSNYTLDDSYRFIHDFTNDSISASYQCYEISYVIDSPSPNLKVDVSRTRQFLATNAQFSLIPQTSITESGKTEYKHLLNFEGSFAGPLYQVVCTLAVSAGLPYCDHYRQLQKRGYPNAYNRNLVTIRLDYDKMETNIPTYRTIETYTVLDFFTNMVTAMVAANAAFRIFFTSSLNLPLHFKFGSRSRRLRASTMFIST
eukprot:jgi/Bigna1/143965/aug1.83_g18673